MLNMHTGVKLHGWDWWQSIGSPKSVCAPMVDQSERAFRMLCRDLGTELCYTPMLHARLYTEVPAYREQHFDAAPDDEPLIAQLAGHDPATVLRAAQMVEEEVAAVDLNFGCPQGIARKGRYGAFLLDEPDTMVALVSTLATELTVPVTAKLRLLPSASNGREANHADSVALCRRLEDAGASVLCVHGRTREQNKQNSGRADWEGIRQVVEAVNIPVVANGGIGSMADVEACRQATGAAAVMSSEALLENPALFCSNVDPKSGGYLDQDELARRYLAVCAQHPPCKGAAMVRGHLFKMLHHGLRSNPDLRDDLLVARTLPEMHGVVDRLAAARWEQPAFHTAHMRPELSWYARHMSEPGMFGSREQHELQRRDGKGGGIANAASTSGKAAAASAAPAAKGDEAASEPESREAAAKAALARRDRKALERQRRNRNRGQGTRSQRGKNRAAAFMALDS